MTVVLHRGWNETLRDQLDFHYRGMVLPRLEGLTDDEYLWEPARGPVTTIAWRINHLTVDCLRSRTASHFGGHPVLDEAAENAAGTAADALVELDAAYDAWVAGVETLGEQGLARPVGPAEGPWAESPYADLVLHINREMIHHGAEICLLRDLYAQQESTR